MAPEPGPDTPAAMGLLNYLSAHALDDDYRVVADRRDATAPDDRAGPGPGPQRRPGGRLLATAVLAVFALLIVVAATQTSRNEVADHHESQALVAQLKDRKEALDADRALIEQLSRRNARLRNQLLDNAHLSAGTRHRLSDLAVAAGTTAVHGPGVVVVVDNAPHSDSSRTSVLDTDLQQLANGLWAAGAEAISINGQRLTNLSSIREAGGAINVNYVSLDTPYTVKAIGDPATMPARFAATGSGQTWLDLQHQVGLRFDMRTSNALKLPAAPAPTLRWAGTVDRGKRGEPR